MALQAFEVSLQMIRALGAPLTAVERRDPSLATQIRRAAASVSLNLAEGGRRRGKDRIHLWRVASGSAAEVEASLRVAEAFGYLDAAGAAQALGLCDRVLRMLWGLTR
ncbi:MAG: four helix bundle protein [Anaeromyxobacteraceae bacterium]